MDLNKKESLHYIFNYKKNSVAEKDIDNIINFQEGCYKYICNFLRVNINMKINYFLCNTPEEVGEIYGDNEAANGFAQMPDKIYAVYNEKVKCIGYHEDAHIISYNALAKPKQNFIREGLAMFFDRVWWGIPNQAWTKEFINSNAYININNLMNNDEFFKYSDSITYPIAGAFTEYLINAYGIEKYKKFYSYSTDNIENHFINIFNITLGDAENDFIKYLDTLRYNEVIYKAIKTSLKTRG